MSLYCLFVFKKQAFFFSSSAAVLINIYFPSLGQVIFYVLDILYSVFYSYNMKSW